MLQTQLQTVYLEVRELISVTKDYIIKNDCPSISVDASHLNLLDAVRATILCSTYHYAKYPQGKMEVIVNSNEVQSLAGPLCLGNVGYLVSE